MPVVTLNFPPKFVATDNNGAVISGAHLWTYAAGGATPLATYTDATGGTANGNPVVCDSSGRADVWCTAAAYKFVLKDSTDATTYWTVDAIPASGVFGSAVTAMNATAVPAGGTAGSGFKFSTTSNFGVFFGSGAPTLAAAKGSLYLRTDGSSTSTRAYINTDSSTTWTAITTAA